MDGTANKGGHITHYIDLEFQQNNEWTSHIQRFYLADLGTDDLILGYPWMAATQPQLNWNNPERNHTLWAAPEGWMIRNLVLDDGDEVYIGIRKTTHAQQLAEAAHDKKERSWTELVPKELHEFERVFSEEAAQRFPEPKHWDHAIDLLEGAPAVLDCKVYPLTQQEQEALRKFITEHLQKGYIRPSNSPYAAPFFFVKKKDGKLRPVQDYRRLNQWTKKNRYPLPLIAELVDKVPGNDWYSTMDIRWGYNNVRIKDGNQWKAAFKTNQGLFEPTVMFFGLTNSPGTFQMMMDDIFRAELAEGWMKVYMDDILVATKGSKDYHFSKIRIILQKLQENDLFLKPEKCRFAQKSVEYLGVIVGTNGVGMDSVKLNGLLDWPTPRSVTEVRSFLGFGNFYKPFIADYAKTARPLHDLTKKGVKFEWTDRHQQAFQTLKNCFASNPVLATINYDKPFTMQTDASAFAIGATLTQPDDQNIHHPMAFFSASLQPAEINYDIYDRELLAIVKAFRHWRQHLLGAQFPITVLTDHNNLSYFREPHKISGRQARWLETLADYDFTLKHVPGNANTVADLLSQRPDHKEGMNDINDNVTVLPNSLFVNKITLSDDINERRKAVKELHDTPIAGHPGIANTWALVNERYEGEGLRQFVEQYVKGCPTCQTNKSQRQIGRAPTQHLDTPVEEGPFQYISMDLITDLPISGKYDSILTIMDQGCSKATKFIPCTKTITGEGIANLYVRHLLPWFGLPRRIVSDRDPRFTSTFTKEICRQTGIQQNLSTAFHPQTDGQTERMNMWVEQYLRHWVNQQGQNDWAQYLPVAEYAHNSWPHDVTKKSPHELLFGIKTQIHVDTSVEGNSPLATDRLISLQQTRMNAAQALLRRYKTKEPKTQYEVGQQVWLEGKNIPFNIPTRKFAPK